MLNYSVAELRIIKKDGYVHSVMLNIKIKNSYQHLSWVILVNKTI